MNYHIISFILFLFFSIGNLSSQNPVPAREQSKPILIKEVVIHIGNGKKIENGFVLFEHGKIEYVGQEMPEIKAETMLIECKGQALYPGFIAMNTKLGLVEIGAVRATRDFRETGDYNTAVRSIIAYNSDSEIIPTVRSNGVLLAQVMPEGGILSGQSSLVQLDAWNWEDALIAADEGIVLNWPKQRKYNYKKKVYEDNEAYSEQIKKLDLFFLEAKAYRFNPKDVAKNLNFEALQGVFEGDKNLYIFAQKAVNIQKAVEFAINHDIKPVIVGASEAYLITDFLKQNEVNLVIASTHRLPGHEDENIEQPFLLPKQLNDAGLLFAMHHRGSWELRNLPFMLGQAVAFGLDYEKAIESVTLSAAKIMGVSDKLGTIEQGKDATFFISKGDALDLSTNQLTFAFIEGRQIDLDNKQSKLYRKYKEKYRLQKD